MRITYTDIKGCGIFLSFINGYLSFWESILVNDRRVLWYFHTLLKTTTKKNEISKRKKDRINKKTNEKTNSNRENPANWMCMGTNEYTKQMQYGRKEKTREQIGKQITQNQRKANK